MFSELNFSLTWTRGILISQSAAIDFRLASEAIAETDRAKLDVVLSELRAAVHERIEKLRVMAQDICAARHPKQSRRLGEPDEKPSALLGTSSAASEETDAKKLIELVKEINRILMEERAATSRNNSLSAAD